jgi:hypothetical protein
MKERLVELVKKAHDEQKYLTSDKSINAIADYILADGWLRPPCKVGDILYAIDNCTNHPEKLVVIAVHQYEKHTAITTLSRSQRVYAYEEEAIGKYVFRTREQAQAKLKEGGKG